MHAKYLMCLVTGLFLTSCHLSLESPTMLRAFNSPATSEEVIRFSQRAASRSDLLTAKVFGYSETGIPLIAVRAAAGPETKDNALKVMIFAQQHGDEQSGKEAALLLISDLAKKMHHQWFPDLEIWIIPQMNPDGSDVNQRRNAGGIDMNRDHIAQLAPETRALHALFHQVKPHVTIDIHEYQPFRQSWKEFGGYKTFDVQVGIPTHPNIDSALRSFANDEVLPAIENHLIHNGFSFHNYLVGPVPTEDRTRHSTVDFDDGRNSFAILGSLALIYEGINGPDGYTENLERRTFGQYEALMAVLSFLHQHSVKTKLLVDHSRAKLLQAQPGETLAIRMEHFPDGNPLLLPLTSSRTGLDTLVVIENYHPVVKSTLDVKRPLAYLIPRSDTLLEQFLNLHRINYKDSFDLSSNKIIAQQIKRIRMSIDEELSNRYPDVSLQMVNPDVNPHQYLLVPAAQLHANFLVSLFEPQSMLGLAQRPGFEYLLEEGTKFPILRVE